MEDEALSSAVRASSPDNSRLTFEICVGEHFEDIIGSNLKLYKELNGNPEFDRAAQGLPLHPGANRGRVENWFVPPQAQLVCCRPFRLPVPK